MNVYRLFDNFFCDLSQSAIYCTQNVDIYVLNSVFGNCKSDYGAAICSISKTHILSRICCHTCHASKGGSTIFTSACTYCNDSSCCCCSPNQPVKDDIFNVDNDCYLKRLNFSQNWASGSCSFQCCKSQVFSIENVICTNGKNGHVVEICDTDRGTMKNLIIVENSYSNAGILFDLSSSEAITLNNCIFAKNEGNAPFIVRNNLAVIDFVSCEYEGTASFGIDTSEVTKTSCIIPSISAGVSTYECHGAAALSIHRDGYCSERKSNIIHPALSILNLVSTINY